ncbi:MAG: signal recognition particle-docking protein FtsY [Myxococcales bacterium]|nr:signal recognition particle-docking protein FtsY [Polyangiaceae bacterium]MDW8250240.1 signal recognition particle-docking protein FtsY [Myxococcales bacterium]
MDPTILAVLVVAGIVIAVIYFTVINKKPAELPRGEEPQGKPSRELLEGDQPKKNELKEKLDKKREEQQKTNEDREKEAEAEKQAKEKAAKEQAEAEEKERQTQEARRAEDEARKRAEDEARKKATEEAARKKAEEAASRPAEPPKPAEVAPPPESVALPRRAPPTATPKAASERDVAKVRRGLARSTGDEGFFGRLSALVRRKEFPPELLDELQEVLLTSDVGVKTTDKLLERIRTGLERKELTDPARVWDALRQEAKQILSIGGGGITLVSRPTVVMMVGVNGAGKTTTIAKIATQLTQKKKSVIMAAGDTFRAAAVQQLEAWGNRVGCPVIKGKDGADPAGVVFDAISKGKQEGADVILCDTAGRLQTKTPLMDELKKIARSAAKALDGAPHETLLVIDATNGQNALTQAKLFNEALPLTGLVLTKLDGTAKGGVILQICDELKIPVRYIGLGERSEDLHEFDADEYVEAVFGDHGKDT